MLAFARKQVGKPFSPTGMARSIIYPRSPDGKSWCVFFTRPCAHRPRRGRAHPHTRTPALVGASRFCAELVAAALQHGGLMSMQSNPSAATPESLFRLYKSRAATTGNPFTLRSQFAHSAPQRALTAGGSAAQFAPPAAAARAAQATSSGNLVAAAQARCSEPPKAGLRVLSAQRVGAGRAGRGVAVSGLSLSLESLNVRPRGR